MRNESMDSCGIVTHHLADGPVRHLRDPTQGQTAQRLDHIAAQPMSELGFCLVGDTQSKQVEQLAHEQRKHRYHGPNPRLSGPAGAHLPVKPDRGHVV